MYEGAEGVGHLILLPPDNESIEFLAQFSEPVSFREPRWVRKVLQMATLELESSRTAAISTDLGN
jgi:hypothetical protein